MTDRKKFGELVSQYIFKETSNSNIDLLGLALQGGIKVHVTRLNEGRMEKTTIFFFHFKERSMSTWNYSTFRDFSGMCSESCDLT